MSQFLFITPPPQITHRVVNANTLDEVFPRAIGENTPSAHLMWNGLPVRMHYSYDAYKSALGLAALVQRISENTTGAATLMIMTDLLIMEWKIQWGADVSIHAEFMGRTDAFDAYALAFNKHREVKLPKQEFVREVRKWLKQLNDVVQQLQLEDFQEEQTILVNAIQQTEAV